MIISVLKGGLGNQMFQYAAARCLSVKKSCPFKLCISNFIDHETSNITKRDYSLNNFNIKETLIESNLSLKILKKLGLIKSISDNNFNKKYLEEIRYRTTILDGYWQSEKYFEEITNTIFDEFSLKTGFCREANYFNELILKSNSVSIHLRCGDYKKNSLLKTIYYDLTESYYNEAISIISRNFPDINFFIFSDDLPYARKFFESFEMPKTFIELKEDLYWQEIILMSHCKHNIISNSTFSWWGAWLNKNKNKIVVAPQNWFINDVGSSKEIVPETWRKI
jgi:hypothetical protein